MSRFVQPMGLMAGGMFPLLGAAFLSWALLAGSSGAAPGDDVAAKWKTLEDEILPAFKDRKELNSRASKARGMILGAIPYSGGEAAFEEYYLKYVFPNWTLTDEDHLGSLAKERDRFLTYDLAKSNGAVHDKLVELTLTKIPQIALDQDLHPAVRYNAVLILGGLNAREASRLPPTNPEPHPRAYPILEGLFANADESDAVRVAALLGILRHLEWDDYRVGTPKLAADSKTKIVQELIALAEASDPPRGRSLAGHTWMRRRALEGLMFASQAAGPPPGVAAVIEKLISSDAEPIALRCAAADVMGRINYKAPAVPAAEVNGTQLGLLALASCQAELTRLENEEKLASLRTKLPSQYGSGFAGGMPGGMMMPGGGPPPGMMMSAPPTSNAAPPDMTSMMQGMMGTKGKKGKTSKSKTPGPMNPLDMMQQAGGPMVPGVGAPKADSKNYQLESVRRRLRSWLFAVQVGLGDERANPANEVTRTGFGAKAKFGAKYNRGVAAYTQTPEQLTGVQEIIAGVQNLVAVVETPDVTSEAFITELRNKMKDLEQITGPLPAAAAPPAEVPVAPAAAAVVVPDVPSEATPAVAPAPPTAAADDGSTAPVAAPPAAAAPGPGPSSAPAAKSP